ncbi:hypothetical protein HPB52_023274 [Rhipicephalus sanguineus]|uniref:G-protein coupled receptors family 1 profile domain-containing protein n=1 Tax=Rhipicephalus sanguineus TaxID=34632 RepID=A0A9D4PSS2_RHISA|nr:hypothetical protein HPB52_023274 [Rhipicephalus sanguineus]
MALSGLKKNTFVGLDQVTTLNLRNNKLQYVEDGAFQGLKSVTSLDIQGNDIEHFSHEMFHGLHSLESLFSDSFKFCCLASPQVSFDYCLPPADEISSCEDLMSSPVQRSFLWVLGVVALLGNLFVIAWRLKTKNSNPVSSTLILSLGCADLLMGVYLVVIASVDIYYRGRYIQNSDVWRASALCKLCGFLSTLSSESSIFTLVLITADRLICISFPFSMVRFGLRRTYQLIAAAWATAAAIAALPIVIQPYFQGEFYARSGVCLALHITNQKPSGWEYSVAVFFCLNLLAFASIVAAYAYMYLSIRRSKTAVKRHAARQADSLVGRQMALIVLTNSLCWFPMIVMGLMAMSGVRIPGESLLQLTTNRPAREQSFLVGCKSRTYTKAEKEEARQNSQNLSNFRFFKIPKVRVHEWGKTRQLSQRRQREWIASLNRKGVADNPQKYKGHSLQWVLLALQGLSAHELHWHRHLIVVFSSSRTRNPFQR